MRVQRIKHINYTPSFDVSQLRARNFTGAPGDKYKTMCRFLEHERNVALMGITIHSALPCKSVDMHGKKTVSLQVTYFLLTLILKARVNLVWATSGS